MYNIICQLLLPVIGIFLYIKIDCLRLFVVVYKLVVLMLCCW